VRSTPARVCAFLLFGMLLAAAPANAAQLSAHGRLIQPALNANQSSNWFGYNQGSLELGGKQFNAISGDWTVPAATQHTRGQDEYSSDWIGIGGGCVDSACAVGDGTLIQTGTESDVDASGKPSYSAWWEVIPGPSIDITMTVAAGDHMHASLAELLPGSNVWTITLQNVTRAQTFTTTVPYSSSHLTAEWIEETPLLIGTNAGLAALPNLTDPAFTNATTNGVNANLQTSEQIFLIDANSNVIGAPSAPNATHDGFSACTWATSC
jgi:Peptidase A4 family